MTLNVELLDRTLACVIAHPDEHDQNRWSACFAGHALRQSGFTRSTSGGLKRGDEELFGEAIGEKAASRLGLTARQSDALFWTADDLESVIETVGRIKSGEIE